MSRASRWVSLLCAPILLLLLVVSLDLSSCSPPERPLARTSVAVTAQTGIQAPSGCGPLPAPAGDVIHVDPSGIGSLTSTVASAHSGDTILLADGVYDLHGVYLRLATPGVTLRSASGNREAVILDGNYQTAEIVQIAASDVTIADLTLRRALHHPIHVVPSEQADTLRTVIYNVHVIDPGQQAIKINQNAQMTRFVDDGLIACSHIELTDAGRPRVWEINDNCYTGGVDAHQARDWTVRDNLIEGFWCDRGLSEHSIHFWRGCRDTLVERNVLRDNARGIGFGLVTTGPGRTYDDDPCPAAGGGYVDHYGGVIRNNVVFAGREALFASQYGFDCGVCLWQACGASAVHNTVASTTAPFSSIEWRFDHTDVDVVNNLVTHQLRDRGGTARLAGNLQYQPLSLFVDGAGGDLHLDCDAQAAIDRGADVAAGLCDGDLDSEPRPQGAGRDVGADEACAAPSAVSDLRVVEVLGSAPDRIARVQWTAPARAVTRTLRYAGAVIDESSWGGAADLVDPFSSDASPGSTESLTATWPLAEGTVYLALRSQNEDAQWSSLSNPAFWPRRETTLPLVARGN